MPFKSKAQEKFMFAKHPEIAARFAAETKDAMNLPEKAESKSVLKKAPDYKVKRTAYIKKVEEM